MLVLTRKNSESIIIAESIEVTVLAIHGRRVKLGIRCDRSIPVRREEIELPLAAAPRKRDCAGAIP